MKSIVLLVCCLSFSSYAVDLRSLLSNRDITLNEKRAKSIENIEKYNIGSVGDENEDVEISSVAKDYLLLLDRTSVGGNIQKVVEVSRSGSSSNPITSWIKDKIGSNNSIGWGTNVATASRLDESGNLVARTTCESSSKKIGSCFTITHQRCEIAKDIFFDYTRQIKEINKCRDLFNDFEKRFQKLQYVDGELAKSGEEDLKNYLSHKGSVKGNMLGNFVNEKAQKENFIYLMNMTTDCAKFSGLLKSLPKYETSGKIQRSETHKE